MATKPPIPNDALDDRLAFVGTSGSGKTYNAGGAVERLLSSGARVVIVDPLDVWWGLRLASDGKTASRFSLPIFGGAHGDLPLNEHAGKLIGETVSTMAESCIVSLGGLPSKSAERRFMLSFLEAIYRHASGNPVHLVFDEADLWAPQKASEPMLQSRMEEIVRRGRVRGFIPWLITQRPAVLSKDVLSQVDGLVAFKLTSSQDRDAIGNWVEGQADKDQWKRIWASMPTLARGTGVVWLPARGILDTASFPSKDTFDSSRTPKRGEKRSATSLRPLDLGKLKDRLASIEAETKANDPAALKAELAKLRKDLANKPTQPVADPQAEQRGYERGLAEGLARGESRAKKVLEGVHSRLLDATAAVALASDGLDSPIPAPVARPTTRTETAPPRKAASTPPATDGLTAPQQRIMSSLGFWKSIGQEAPTREQVAAVAGYRPGSGNFNNLIGGLSSAGQTHIPQQGRVALSVDYPGLSPDEAKAKLWSVFENPQRRLVEAALNVAGELSRDDLAVAAGYAPGSGNFNNIVGSLTSMDVLRRTGQGRIELSEWAREVLS